MTYNSMKVGKKVHDSWFKRWGNGTVRKIYKNTVHIDFIYEGMVIFDIPHLQFLRTGKIK